MDKLASYVASILAFPGGPEILRKENQETVELDASGYRIKRSLTRFYFAHAVIIEREIEEDDAPSELACAECSIDYRVISSGNIGSSIQPAFRSFDNRCREAHWLAYHLA